MSKFPIYMVHKDQTLSDKEMAELDKLCGKVSGFDSPEVKDQWLKANAEQKGSWFKRLGAKASENIAGGSHANYILRSSGIMLGAMMTFDGVAQLLKPRRQVISPEGEATTPSHRSALIELAAGVGVTAASAFLKTGKSPSL